MCRAILLALLLLVPVVSTEKKETHPGYSPVLWLAVAFEVEGKVVIQISRPGPVLSNEANKLKTGDRSPTRWVRLRKVKLGDTVQAFGVDGKPLASKAVLKALARPRGVVVFLRSYANDPLIPPAFYRNMLRDGTVLLVTRAEPLDNPKP